MRARFRSVASGAFLLLAVSACSGNSSSARPGSAASYPGQPGFRAIANGTVLRLHGTPLPGFSVAHPAGRVAVIHMWAQWCGPCRKEAPLLRAAQAQLAPHGVLFVGVDTEDAQGKAQRFAHAQGWTWAQDFDEDGQTLHDAGFVSLPDTVIVSPAGRVEGEIRGPITNVASFVRTVSGLTRRT